MYYGRVKMTRSVNSILIMPAYGHVIFVLFLCINELALIGPLFSVALALWLPGPFWRTNGVKFGCGWVGGFRAFLKERREVVCGVNSAFLIVFSGRYGIFTIVESLDNDVNCKNPAFSILMEIRSIALPGYDNCNSEQNEYNRQFCSISSKQPGGWYENEPLMGEFEPVSDDDWE